MAYQSDQGARVVAKAVGDLRIQEQGSPIDLNKLPQPVTAGN